SRWAAGTDPVGGSALPRLSLQPESAGLGRVVVLLGDQPLVQHLLVLGQLGDRVLGLSRRGLRRGWRLRRRWLLSARRWLLSALLRVALRRVALRAALRWVTALLRVATLWRVPGRLLEPGRSTAGGVHPHPHERQPVTAAALAGGLEPTGSGLLHERVAPGTAQRIGLLHVAEQLAGVLVVLDRLDGDLGDRQASVGGPPVALLHRCAQRLGE